MTRSKSSNDKVDGLKPCPFCGEKDQLYPGFKIFGRKFSDEKPYQIDCLGCGIEFTPREGMDVVAKWNARSKT